MEFLHTWKQKGTPELHATELPPIFINPTWALAEILGDLLDGHYAVVRRGVNHGCSLSIPTSLRPRFVAIGISKMRAKNEDTAVI